MRGGFSGRISDVVLGLAGAAALSLIGAAGYREAVEAARPRQVEPPGMTAARRAMDALTPENGWFPYLADPIFGFESGLDEWRLEERGDGPREIETSDGGKEGCRPSQGKSALSVPVAFPDPTTVFRSPPGVAGVRAFVYDVYVPEGAPGFIGCLMFLKDKDGRWFQARNPHRLIPGRWNTVVAEISGGSPDVAPLGHMGSWDASQATQIRTIGFTFYGSEPWKGRLLLDNIRGCMLPDRFISMLDRVAARGIPDAEKLSPAELEDRKKRVEALRSLVPAARAAASAASSKLELLNWTAGPDTVPRFGTFEIRFELPGQIDNPFDPNIADVSAAFIAPSGKQIGVFGYYDQDYERRRADLKDDLIPVGRPFWRIRFTPREVGEYSYSVRVRALGGEIVTSKRTFRTVQSPDPGFIRVSRGDPYCFEYETGGFFYPIGHNVHSPIDLRCAKVLGLSPPPPDLGTFLYDDIFAKMEAAGENTVEIWMSSWWLGIEWTSRWKGYQGPGRYNLDNAWKLDYALALARKHGLKVHLVIDNHGKMSNWCDPEWKDSPHNQYSDYNGSVRNVRDFFTDPTARELHKRRLRYIIARWAGDPTIMGFELVSEYDLIADNRHFYRTPTAQAWLREMMTFFRENDPYGRPLTNHYATDYRYIDMEMARTPLFDYVTGDGYRPAGAFYPLAVDTSRYLGPLRKPFLITEFGGNWDGTTESRLEADLHTGLWASFMTLAGGTPLFWWYDFIDRRDLYFHYKAFAGFVSGEDRRGQDFAPFEGAVPSGGRLQYLGIRGRDVTYLWIFDPAAMEDMPPPESRPYFSGISLSVPGLAPGRYEVEYWDTYRGGRIASEIRDSDGGRLSCNVPAFRNDIAVKIRRYDADRLPAPGSRPAPGSGPAPAPASGPSHAPTGSGDGTGR